MNRLPQLKIPGAKTATAALATLAACRRWPLLAAGLATSAALIAGCGGGGSDAGTTTGTAGSTTPSASAAAYTEGTLTGFGSVIVNGVRFDDSAAKVYDDSGTLRSSSALKLGMQVALSSTTVDSSTGTATCSELHFGSRLLGPVEAVSGSTVTVLGQLVDISDATVFDSTLATGLAALTVGAVIEVHGLPDAATGHILATRVEPATSATSYKLRGTLAALDATAKTFAIGAATVAYGSATLKPTSLVLANDRVVRVVLATTPVNGQWVATSVGSSERSTTTGQTANVRGTVSAYNATAKTFSLDGLKVDASAVASLPSTLADGVEVRVTGTVSNSVLVASTVTISDDVRGRHNQRFELHGAITTLDTTAKTFLLRGVTVTYSGTVTYTNGVEADLAVGKRVEVKGAVGSTRTQVQATTIKFEN